MSGPSSADVDPQPVVGGGAGGWVGDHGCGVPADAAVPERGEGDGVGGGAGGRQGAVHGESGASVELHDRAGVEGQGGSGGHGETAPDHGGEGGGGPRQ